METPVEVTPEIIAQAEKLGYRVGYINHPPSPFDHLFIMARPLHSPLAIGSAFQLGPFETEEAATQHLPEIVRCHARAQKLTENYTIGVRENGWMVFHPSEPSAGPFDNPTAALDEAERLADKARRIYEGRIAYARQEHLRAAHIPPAFAGIDLGNLEAKITPAWGRTLEEHPRIESGFSDGRRRLPPKFWRTYRPARRTLFHSLVRLAERFLHDIFARFTEAE
jgi:hypothetical protein